MAGVQIQQFTASITAYSITDATPIISGKYVRNMTTLKYSVTFSWSGITTGSTTRVFPEFSFLDASGNAIGIYGIAKEYRTGNSGASGTLTGTIWLRDSSSYSNQTYKNPFQPTTAGTYSISISIGGMYDPGIGGTSWYSLASGNPGSTQWLEYTKPAITNAVARRTNASGVADDQGTYVRFDFSAYITRAVGTENGTYSITVNENGASTGYVIYQTTGLSLNVSNVTLNMNTWYQGNFNITSTYTFTFNAWDNYTQSGPTWTKVIVPVGLAVFHLNASKNAMGIGKYVTQQNMLDVGYPAWFENTARFSGAVSFDNPRQARQGGLKLGGLSAGILDETRTSVDAIQLLPTMNYWQNLDSVEIPYSYTYHSEYNPSCVTPILWQNRSYNYVFQVVESGYYAISVDWLASTVGSDANTSANARTRVYIVTSTAYVPTGSVSVMVWGMSSMTLTSGAPSSYYRYFDYYSSAATSTTSSGVMSIVTYIPAGYIIYPCIYVRTIRKQIDMGSIGIARLS